MKSTGLRGPDAAGDADAAHAEEGARGGHGDELVSKKMSTAKPLAPEDIRPGEYVSVLHAVEEFLTMSVFGPASWDDLKTVRVCVLPEGDMQPMRVEEVCLPFVLVKLADGGLRTLDVRRYQFARVTERFARRAVRRVRTRAGEAPKAEGC